MAQKRVFVSRDGEPRGSIRWADNMADKIFYVTGVDETDPPDPPDPEVNLPLAADGSVTVASGGSGPIDLTTLTSPGDLAINVATYEVVANPAVGSLSAVVSGVTTYTAPVGYGGPAGFLYMVQDTAGNPSNVAAVAITVTPPPPASPDYPNGYGYGMEFRVRKEEVSGTGAMANFLMLVDITHNSLKTVGNGGLVRHASGFDMRWQSPAGALLPFHRIFWSGTTGRAVFIVRVTVNAGADSGRTLFIGKNSMVAPEENLPGTYAGYWAIWQGRTGVDLSGNGRHLTPANVTDGADIWGDSGDYNGTNSTASATLTGWAGAAALSIQELIDRDYTGQNRGHLSKGPTTGAGTLFDVAIYDRSSNAAETAANVLLGNVSATGGDAFTVSGPAQHTTDPEWITLNWISGEEPKLYRYGEFVVPSSVQAATGTTTDDGNPFRLGDGPANTQFPKTGTFDGRIEQARVMRGAALSTDFLATEGRNYKDPDLFYGHGGAFDPPDSNRSPVAFPLKAAINQGDATFLSPIVYDPDGDVTTLLSVTTPAKGTASVAGDQISYTAPTIGGASGDDTFFYLVEDEDGATSTAKVKVSVTAVAPPPPPPPPPPASTYRYNPMQAVLAATTDANIIIVPVNPNGTTTVPDPNDWTKLIMLDFGAVPLTKFSMDARGVGGAGIKARGIVGVGATLRLTGMSTNLHPNGTPGKGNDIFNVCWKSGAPTPPIVHISRIDYDPVNMEYGDFFKVGTKIIGTVPNWNVAEYGKYYFAKSKMRNGHWTWTAPDGNKNSHSDLFQSSLGGYGFLCVSDVEAVWSGNGWYYLVAGNIQNAPSGKTFGPNTCEFILDHVNMSPSIPLPGSGLSPNPAQYFLQSGMLDGFGGWNYPVATLGNSTALAEGRYTSLKLLDVWCRLGPGKPDMSSYFGFPNIPKTINGDGVDFTNFIAPIGKRPDGKGRVEGARRVRFIGPAGTFPNVVVTDAEVGHLKAVRTKTALRAEFA